MEHLPQTRNWSLSDQFRRLHSNHLSWHATFSWHDNHYQAKIMFSTLFHEWRLWQTFI
ncbi:protein of unknown function [Magnetospirillum sp. XM-1]|nr:protein of unknown function [Magnetospirillum sp. XM-1]